MPTVEGQLVIDTDGQVKFTSDKVTVNGVYTPSVNTKFEVKARAHFERAGPYNFQGDIGTFGVNLRLDGPVGQGTIVGERVPTGMIVITGSVYVQFTEDNGD